MLSHSQAMEPRKQSLSLSRMSFRVHETDTDDNSSDAKRTDREGK
jgi:hypothetical protein